MGGRERGFQSNIYFRSAVEPYPDPPGYEIICLNGAGSENIRSGYKLTLKIIICPSIELTNNKNGPLSIFCGGGGGRGYGRGKHSLCREWGSGRLSSMDRYGIE